MEVNLQGSPGTVPLVKPLPPQNRTALLGSIPASVPSNNLWTSTYMAWQLMKISKGSHHRAVDRRYALLTVLIVCFPAEFSPKKPNLTPHKNSALAPALRLSLSIVSSVGMTLIRDWAFLAINRALSQISSMETPWNAQFSQPTVLQGIAAWHCRRIRNETKARKVLVFILSSRRK